MEIAISKREKELLGDNITFKKVILTDFQLGYLENILEEYADNETVKAILENLNREGK
ncbi:hypothetical protein [Thermoanaerobacterium sp. DL9XJH110]|uniref:hypothetical protein n=1 Tax=Thermoanaerobacterium sp. DL9XJH110 TaxID=3386643 RepID=UPI003BB796D9